MDHLTEIVVVAILVIFLVLTYVLKRPGLRAPATPNIDAANGILMDINENIKIVEEHISNPQSTKKFQTRKWQRFKDKTGFLDYSVIDSLDEAFEMVDDFNLKIESAKKSHALASLENIQIEKIREPLKKSKEGISDWLRANYHKEMQGKKGGIGEFLER